MIELWAEVKKLFEHAREGLSKDRANFTVRKQDATPFIGRERYMQILVNEMYLSKEREW